MCIPILMNYCYLYIHICKVAHLDQSQPVPLRGFETFCYGAPKMCAIFWGGAKKTSAMARWHWLDGRP